MNTQKRKTDSSFGRSVIMIALALLALIELLSSLLEMQRVVFAISTCCVGSFNVLICPIQHVVSSIPS